MAQIQQSQTSDNDTESYPQNVAGHTLAPYILETIRQQLNSEAPRLFTGEAGAALDFLDFGDGAQGMFVQCHPLEPLSLKFPIRFLANTHR